MHRRGIDVLVCLLGFTLFAAGPAAAQLTIVHDDSVIPPRVQEALDIDPFGDFPVLPGEVPMNVGALVKLRADAPGVVTNVQWTIPGSIIKDYSIASARGTGEGFLTECSTTDLSSSDLRQQEISYYYTDRGTSQVGVTALVDGVPDSDTLTFAVERHPKADLFYVTGPGSAAWTNDQFNSDFEDRNNTIGEHPVWHVIDPGGEEFNRFHRGYIAKSDCWRGIFGYSCVQVYAGAPGYVPAGDDVDHRSLCCIGGPPPCASLGAMCEGGPGVQANCPVGETCEARVGTGVINRGRISSRQGRIQELPAQFTIAGGLNAFPVGGNLSTSIQSPYHNAHHSRICRVGDFAPPGTTPNDPMFWRFHHGLNKVFELWQYLKLDVTELTIPPVECSGPAGAQVFFPDPDRSVPTSCTNPQPDPCNPVSGSFIPVGATMVNCVVSDLMRLDATFPEGQCTGSDAACDENDDCPITEVCSGFGGVCLGMPCDSNVDCPIAETCDTTAFNQGTTTDVAFEVEVVDTLPPTITCPANTTIECDESTDPADTGEPAATDVCDAAPATDFSDDLVPGSCEGEGQLTRTWTATDSSLNDDSCDQLIDLVDETAPQTQCNAPPTIVPPDAPISFTATTVDNCDSGASVEITGFDCFKFTRKGKRIDKTESCVVDVSGDTITILDSGGVGDHISWTARATDDCGNFADTECQVEVVNPGKSKKK